MSVILYNIFLSLYYAGISIYSLFNVKAKKWIDGRRGWEAKLKTIIKEGEPIIWVHCSSLGEYEQGKPLMQALRGKYPNHKILLTFFSPSGYEAYGKQQIADFVMYLPYDTQHNARKFIKIVGPSLVIFIKYEFWHHYLYTLKQSNIPVLLVSAIFRKEQSFFKKNGSFFRKMLRCFTYIFVQDDQSQKLLSTIGIEKKVMMAGDTRYDRVATIANNITPIPEVEGFKAGYHILIAGSTWASDEVVLQQCLQHLPEDWKMIIAPHEVNAQHIDSIMRLFGEEILLFSEVSAEHISIKNKVLVIDNIGMLSRLYSYGDIALVGGGFDRGGVHNVLEPAVFGLPVIMGPVYEKYIEATDLVNRKYAFPVHDATECVSVLHQMMSDDASRILLKQDIKAYMQQKIGATDKVMSFIVQEGYLK